MRLRKIVPILVLSFISVGMFGCSSKAKRDDKPAIAEKRDRNDLIFRGESHFKNLRQLTFGGDNAEAYFNAEGTELIFQSTRDDLKCDQIFRMDNQGENVRMVSNGEGRTTCGYLFPNQPKILYSSSFATEKACPPKPDYSKGYVWPLMQSLDIYVAGPNGENPTALAASPGYDAEGVISSQGDAIIFTSTRGGDIDIWRMDADGTNLKQLTTEVGYDGGAFFSYDGTKIVYRAKHPTNEKEMSDYKGLLAENLVRPSVMDLYVMNSDGTEKTKILANGAANFAPYFHPDGKRIVFSSNMDSSDGRDFDLYLINVDGSGLKRITFNDSFDAFPMFSHDGSQLVFSSNRGGKDGETNVFIADWTDVAAVPELPAKSDAGRWLTNATALSTPKMQGRALGSEGIEAAAKYIETQFKAAGLEPAGNEGYRQSFPASVASKLKKTTVKSGKTKVPSSGARALSFSASTKVDAAPVFVGFGITSKEYDYDDYAKVDATGKIAVAFRYEPDRKNAKSPLAGVEPIRESDLRFKAINAKHHGATGLVIINPPDIDKDSLAPFKGMPSEASIPVVHLTWKAAKKAFPQLDGAFKQYNPKTNSSVQFSKNVSLDVSIDRVVKPIHNIVGKFGTGERALVVGAHYDHLAEFSPSSLAPDTKGVHHGADDNASGVASIVEIANALKGLGTKRTVYVVAFTGEESGLLGSHQFVENLPVAKEKIDLMLNFDMVGRLRNNTVSVLGVGTGAGLLDIVRRAQLGTTLDLNMTKDGFGPSDQMAFYAEKIPVLHFFTGLHEDYHRPTDTADKLNPQGAASVTDFALRVIVEAEQTESIAYAKVGSARGGDRGDSTRSYGPYFGSIPAFGGPEGRGVKISGTRPGSPANKAGLIDGDVIVGFGKFTVTSMKDYAYALRQHKVGDSLKVVVMRKGQKVELDVVLEAKKGGSKKGGHGHHGEPKKGASSQSGHHQHGEPKKDAASKAQ